MTEISHFHLPESEADLYPTNRQTAYSSVLNALSGNPTHVVGQAAIVRGDSLEALQLIPSKSVDLIVTDPPYHSSKKENIFGDTSFEDDDAYLQWMERYFTEWHRVLKPHGSLYLFCSSKMAPFLYVSLYRTYNMHNTIAWSKPNEPGYDGWKQKMNKRALRAWYPHSERVIFASPAYEGNLKRTLFGQFLKTCRKMCGLTSKQLTELIGEYGKVNNGGAVSNWETGRNIPSKEQWEKIVSALRSTKKVPMLPAYEDVIRPFNVDPDDTFVDVWDHMNVRQYKGKHPAEKPLDLLELIISTSSYEGDVVLDCFAGSGATLSAAQKLNRRSVGIEIEERWCSYAVKKLEREARLPAQSLSPGRDESTSEFSGLPLLERA